MYDRSIPKLKDIFYKFKKKDPRLQYQCSFFRLEGWDEFQDGILAMDGMTHVTLGLMSNLTTTSHSTIQFYKTFPQGNSDFL